MSIQMRCFRCGWTIRAESVSAAMLAEDAHGDECQPAKQVFIHPANKPGFFIPKLGENTMSEAFLDTGYVRDQFIRGAYSQREMAKEFDLWLDSVKADAWDEGADTAWRATGEGHNGEYAGPFGTHDGTVPFLRANEDTTNPYRKEHDA